MKLSYIIILSLGLNAILVASVARQKSSAAPSLLAGGTNTLELNEKKIVKEGKSLNGPIVVDVPGEAFSWRKIEAEEYHRYVANLRAIHCPEETIQDIIYNDVTKLYAEKQRALNREYKYGPSGASDYWKTDNQFGYSAERNRKARELEKEKTDLLIALLGVDVEKLRRERQGIPDYEALQYPFLTEEKRKQVKELAQRFQDQEQGLYQKWKDFFGDERNAEFVVLNKQRDAELAQILTPYEMEEYKLRQSNTSQQMRYSLQAFEPSEQEFRSLFKVEDAWTSVHGMYFQPDTDDPVEMKKWADMQKLRDDQYKQALGEDRYKEFSRAKSYEYQQLYRMVQSSGLPKETASKVYDVKEAAESQISKVRNDQSLSPDQRQQALTAIKEATVQAVQTSLGEKNYKKYESNGGYWLRNLSPNSRSSTMQSVIAR